jgi:exonuclease III
MRVLLLNTRGLATNPKVAGPNGNKMGKRKFLSTLLSVHKIDIAIFVETHKHDNKDFPSHWEINNNATDSQSQGITIIIPNPVLSQNVLVEHKVPGRCSRLTITEGALNLELIAVYAPADTCENRCNFFKDSLTDNCDILLGDFNMVTDPQDKTSKRPIESSATLLNSYIESNELYDMGKSLNINAHTFKTQKYSARLDRIYATEELLVKTKDLKILDTSSVSDHAALLFEVELKIPKKHSEWFLDKRIFNSNYLVEKINFQILQKAAIYTSLDPFQKYLNVKKDLSIILKREQKLFHKDMRKGEARIVKLQEGDFIQSTLHKKDIDESHQVNVEKVLAQRMQDSFSHGKPCKALTARIKAKKSNFKLESLLINNEVTQDQDLIKKETENFYTKVFGPAKGCRACIDKLFKFWSPYISYANQLHLEKEVNQEELDITLKHLSMHSAPGPDSLPNIIYKSLPGMQKLLIDVINYALEGYNLPTELKVGKVITLYKGKGDPKDLNNRRPITLLNNDYKVISSIVNRRLLRITPWIIDKTQTGFVPGRFIIDNILSVDELLRSRQQSILAFLDIEKAFDSISHDSLNYILYKVGLPPNLRGLIKSLLRDSSVRISIGGCLTEDIPVSKGVKQGDPLSPTLFVIAMELLNRALKQTLQGRNFNGLKITSLMFADDTVIIAASEQDLRAALNILNTFKCATNLRINIQKCEIIEIQTKITDPPFRVIQQGEKCRYLGYWFGPEGLIPTITEKAGKMIESLESWKRMFNNIHTKNQLLKSYSLSQLSYWMYCEEITKNVKTKIERAIDSFLYNQDRKKIRKARERRSFDHGGIGRWSIKQRSNAYKADLFCKAATGKLILADEWIRQISLFITNPVKKNLTTAAKSFLHWRNLTGNRTKLNINVLNNAILNCKENNYTIKSLYEAYQQRKYPQLETYTPDQVKWKDQFAIDYQNIWVTIKKLKAPTKSKEILWSFFQNVLPYRHNSPCPHCGKEITKTHIFFDCSNVSIVKDAMDQLRENWGLKTPPWDIETLLNVLRRKTLKPVQVNNCIILAIMRLIWVNHCDLAHGREQTLHLDYIKSSIHYEINALFRFTRSQLKSSYNFLDPPGLNHITKIRLGLQKWTIFNDILTPTI